MENLCLRIWSLSQLLFLGISCALSQIVIDYQGNSSWDGALDDLWIVEISNAGAPHSRVHFRAVFQNASGETVLEAFSQVITLPTGKSSFRIGDIRTHKSTPFTPSNLPEGSYLFCLTLINRQNEIDLSKYCDNIIINISQNKAETGQNPMLKFSGKVRLSGQFSNRISQFDSYDPSYLNAEIEPQLSIKGLPFSGRIFLSTQQNSFRYDLNTAGLHFDVNQLQLQMREKLMQKLHQHKQNMLDGLPIDSDFGQKLEEIRTTKISDLRQELKNRIPQHLPEQLQQAQQAWQESERLDQILSLPAFKNLEKDWRKKLKDLGYDPDISFEELQQKLCNQKPDTCQKYMDLLSKKEELEKLKARKAELEEWKARYEKLRKYEQQLSQLKELEKGDLRSLIQDPALLQKLPLAAKGQKLLTSIKNIGLGTVFPYYSPLTLDGISLHGWDMAFQPGNFFLATTGGKLGRSALIGFSDSTTNRTGKLIATKMGYGQAAGSHIYTTLLMGRWHDSTQSESLPTQQQLLIGLEGQLDLLDKKWMIMGEWVRALESLDATSGSDAWSVESKLNLFQNKTLFLGKYEKLTPGYFSIGAPLLLRETERFNLEITQSLLKNKLQARAYFRQNSNQLLPHSFEASSIKSAGVSLRFQANKLPYFQIDYAPYYQDFGIQDTTKANANNGVMTTQIGYMYSLGNWQLNTTLNYARQFGKNPQTGSLFSSSLLSLHQMVQFDARWGMNASASYIHSQFSADWNKTWTAEASAYIRSKSGIYSALGLNYLNESGEAGMLRKGIFWDNTLPIGKIIQAQVRLEYSHNENYRPDTPFYQEYMIRGGLIYNW